MNRLTRRLADLIAAEGPITVAQYMMLCLQDPTDGYYASRPALGEAGDFITAPEVSQMFGEMLGLWAASVWDDLGRPAPFRWVELGPGTGALMSDMLRAGRALPGFVEAAELWLVEASPVLQAAQAARLAAARPNFVPRLADVPSGAPLILIGNEFLDCLPTRQFVATPQGWRERRIGIDTDGALVFGLSLPPSGLEPPDNAPIGVVWEASPAQSALGAEIGARISSDGGAALLIDYGRAEAGFGDTLQALKRHQKISPLDHPGEADLTVHADFPAVAAAAQAAGAFVSPIVTQSTLLQRLGLVERAGILARSRPDRAEVLQRQLQRLVDPEQMGVLFKALAIHEGRKTPPGFDTDAPPPSEGSAAL